MGKTKLLALYFYKLFLFLGTLICTEKLVKVRGKEHEKTGYPDYWGTY